MWSPDFNRSFAVEYIQVHQNAFRDPDKESFSFVTGMDHQIIVRQNTPSFINHIHSLDTIINK